MKKTMFYLLTMCAMLSCRQQEVVEELPVGAMSVSVVNNPTVDVSTRAGDEVSTDNFNVHVSGPTLKNSYVYKDMPAMIQVPAGLYTVAAENVSEQQALALPTEWGQIRYAGSVTRDVAAGGVTDFSITCSIVNSLVSVVFDSSLDAYYSDYSVVIYADEDRQLTYTPQGTGTQTPAVGHFNPGTLHYLFNGVFKGENTPKTFSGTVVARAATHSHLTFKVGTQQGSLGRPGITVDTTCEDFYETIVVDPTQDVDNE